MAPVSMSADRLNPFVDTGRQYRPCCAVKLQILHPSASLTYLYCTGHISFPARLLLQQARDLASLSSWIGTLQDQVMVASTLVRSAPAFHNCSIVFSFVRPHYQILSHCMDLTWWELLVWALRRGWYSIGRIFL